MKDLIQSLRLSLVLLGLLLLVVPTLCAQLITGSIVGRVEDPNSLAIFGASVTLTHISTGRELVTETSETGRFVFAGLVAGEYQLSATSEGFKQARKSGIMLSTGETLSVGTTQMELGSVSEVVSVTAEAAAVQTESAERASVITSTQVDSLLIQGRNPTDLVGLLPGVVVTNTSSALDRRTDFNVQGQRRTANNVSIDGIPVVDIDNGFAKKLNVNMDSVAEVKILLSNYQAEYGRNAGSNVHIVTKSGTREFHGTASYFKRHEQFNASNFFDNRNGIAKPRVRFNTWTYGIGGPIYIPGKFNTNKDKLFFYWSQEFWPITQGQTGNVTMPTQIERQGDFSQSVDLNNKLIVINDPTTGNPFPGNIIPNNRIDPSGQALLQMFDDPNFFDRAISKGNYNHTFTSDNSTPKRSDTLKINFNPSNKDTISVNHARFNETSEGYVGTTGQSSNWKQLRLKFYAPNRSWGTRWSRIISPTTINEFQFGWLRNPESHQVTDSDFQRNERATVGFVAGQWVPDNNPLDIIPNSDFSGIPSAARLRVNGRFPADNRYDIMNWDNKVTMIRGSHTIKTGIYGEWFRRDVNQGVDFNGRIDFGRDVNNPLDTGYAFSNAALGVFKSYTEPSSRPRMLSRGGGIEFFIQDNWKVNRKLTLDYGIRFYWIPPIFDKNDLIAGFQDNRFDPAQTVSLLQPGLDANGKRVAVNPVTGEIHPQLLIGALAPGIGNSANGMVTPSQDSGVPRALMNDQGIQFGPRVGFAYDPFGSGKTAVRGGIGFFYNRLNQNVWLPFTAQPPLVQTPILYYSQLSTLTDSSNWLFPSNIRGFDQGGKVPTTYNYSLSVQRDIGFDTVVDIGYVGALGRHLFWARNINPIPAGANFDPANGDPTQPGKPLPPQFLRPRIGHNDIITHDPAGSSSYHSLQVTANRRFTRGLQFGLAWTWSKAMTYNANDNETVSPIVPVDIWNYGPASYDRTHVFKLNYLWDLPDVSTGNPVVRQVLNGWQLSGITSFISGAPLGIGLATTSAFDFTGTPSQGARTVMIADPVLSKSERTFDRNFNTGAFARPPQGSFGNAASTVIRGPGVNNWDIAVFKNFPIWEDLKLQFRAELYNAFNHTQFSALDTTARFDNAGTQVNGRFGAFTGALQPRQIQLALRFYF